MSSDTLCCFLTFWYVLFLVFYLLLNCVHKMSFVCFFAFLRIFFYSLVFLVHILPLYFYVSLPNFLAC